MGIVWYATEYILRANLPEGLHIARPRVRVLGISFPLASTHQQKPDDSWHWVPSYSPSVSHSGTKTPGAGLPFHPKLRCRSRWHCFNPAKEIEYFIKSKTISQKFLQVKAAKRIGWNEVSLRNKAKSIILFWITRQPGNIKITNCTLLQKATTNKLLAVSSWHRHATNYSFSSQLQRTPLVSRLLP